MTKNVYIYLLLVICSLTACSPSLREAQDVVAQADSLWHAGQMYGVDAGDSATLAQAYETLNVIPFPFREGLGLGSSYAHACYHYGKLLRAKDNPEEAMQAFINATHSRTRDYHILGRIYNNMGDICHRAEAYTLSYDMFERSANVFMRDYDTLSYFYCLNDMALELAEQGKKDDAVALLSNIDFFTQDEYVLAKSLETKAIACKKVEQYDSVLYYTSLLFNKGYRYSNVLLLRAQVYSYLGKKDSAVYYANMLLDHTTESYEYCNALYILTNDDETKNTDGVKEVAAQRADTQKLIEIHKGKLSQAVQLLELDINRRPNLAWLYAVMGTLVIVGTCLFIYVNHKRKNHLLLSQKIDDLKNKDAANYANRRAQVEANCDLIVNSSTMKTDLNWKDFESLCKIIDVHFCMLAEKLRQKQILSEQEIRLCILVLLDLNRNQTAEILRYAPNGIGKFKYRVAQKLHVEGKNLRKYLICLAIDEPYK